MAIEQKERYVVTMENGTSKTVVAGTYQEVLQMYGEENVTRIEKLDFQEEKQNG